MELIIGLAVVTIILIVPIKIAASMVGAQRNGIFSCFFAILLSAIIQAAAAKLIPGISERLGVLLSLPLAAIAYAFILGTSFFKGIGIAILQIVVTIGVLFVLALFFASI